MGLGITGGSGLGITGDQDWEFLGTGARNSLGIGSYRGIGARPSRGIRAGNSWGIGARPSRGSGPVLPGGPGIPPGCAPQLPFGRAGGSAVLALRGLRSGRGGGGGGARGAAAARAGPAGAGEGPQTDRVHLAGGSRGLGAGNSTRPELPEEKQPLPCCPDLESCWDLPWEMPGAGCGINPGHCSRSDAVFVPFGGVPVLPGLGSALGSSRDVE